MKVLWVTNTIFPEFSEALGQPKTVGGGWMYALSQNMVDNGIELAVVTAKTKSNHVHKKINNINFYLLGSKRPVTEYDISLAVQWKEVINNIKPDLVHIHGTENGYGLVLMNTFPQLNYVVSIQGLIGIIYRYYYAGITIKEILRSITIRDIIKRDTIIQARRNFLIRSNRIERKYLDQTSHVIGRTQWDHDQVKTMNPLVQYHFCNESLRESFYNSKKWNAKTKINHTIFLSQAGYPIKGLHKVLEAVALMKNEFPDLRVRVAGKDILRKSKSLKEYLKRDGYGKYVHSLVQKYGLETQISFLGYLDEQQMIQEYLNAHIFICPSSIENSPNSLGEAQLLGVPCIASYVGGIPDMVIHNQSGLLYRFEEVEMLAQSIKRIFNADALANKLSTNGIRQATERHDKDINVRQLLSIYAAMHSL